MASRGGAFLLLLGHASALAPPQRPPAQRLIAPRHRSPIACDASRPTSRPDAFAIEPWQAVLALNGATLIWGSQHAVIKDVVEAASPASVNAARFAIAATCSLPWLPGAPWRGRAASAAERERVARTWSAGAELGTWTFLGFALQAIGLQFTTASRSAFLLYLNVKLVPLLALLLYGRRSPARTWASAAVAFGGTALLSFDGSPPNAGDAWSLAAALASACFILRLEEATLGGGVPPAEGAPQPAERAAALPTGAPAPAPAEPSLALTPSEINAATIACAALLTAAWAVGEILLGGEGGLSGREAAARAAEMGAALGEHAAALLYLGLVTTAVAQWLQAVGQSRVGAQDAAVIYALDPVYGAGFSWLLLGETLGPQGFAGGALVLAAVVLSRSAPARDGGGANAPVSSEPKPPEGAPRS